jgi:hypothetical protein
MGKSRAPPGLSEPTPWAGIHAGLAIRGRSPSKGALMLATIAVVLVVLWLLGFFAFHVTAAAIHLILVVALILVVLHFLQGRRSL